MKRVAVVIQGGIVVDVHADEMVQVYILDFDNPVESDHTNQSYMPWVGQKNVDRALALWDETYKENKEMFNE